MSFRKTVVAWLLIAVAGLVHVGCGNYSNEDLEFMNALPERQDLSAEIPARGAVTLADTAELYLMTRNVTVVFNGIVDKLLTLIDTIRSYPPTTRETNERIWGPFPSQDQPDRIVRMVMTRVDLVTFTYAIELRRSDFVGAPGMGWNPLVSGRFAAAGGVRKGSGTLGVNTFDTRAQNLDPGFGYLDHLAIDYDTRAFPITVHLAFTNLLNPSKLDDPTEGDYVYSAQANGQGALSYDFSADTIPGTAGLDTFNVTSRWLGTGEGRSDLQVVSGDAAGARETQCWNAQLQPVYTDKPWAPLDDIGTPSDCPSIPTL